MYHSILLGPGPVTMEEVVVNGWLIIPERMGYAWGPTGQETRAQHMAKVPLQPSTLVLDHIIQFLLVPPWAMALYEIYMVPPEISGMPLVFIDGIHGGYWARLRRIYIYIYIYILVANHCNWYGHHMARERCMVTTGVVIHGHAEKHTTWQENW